MPTRTVTNTGGTMSSVTSTRRPCRPERTCLSMTDGMTTSTDPTRSTAAAPLDGPLAVGQSYYAAVIVAGIGTAVSIFLAWSALTGDSIAGCGEGTFFSCSHVLHSKFSRVWGVPVSIPAPARWRQFWAVCASDVPSDRHGIDCNSASCLSRWPPRREPPCGSPGYRFSSLVSCAFFAWPSTPAA